MPYIEITSDEVFPVYSCGDAQLEPAEGMVYVPYSTFFRLQQIAAMNRWAQAELARLAETRNTQVLMHDRPVRTRDR
jgi:hypothetical protein